MDLASALPDANDFSLDTVPDKQLQPGTPSGQMSQMCDLLLQSYPPRSHTPISKDTEPLSFAGQASSATETHANTMVPIEQRVAALGPAPLLWQDAQQGSRADEANNGPAKHPKIIVRLKRPSTKKSKAAKPDKVASSRTSVRLASKHSPSGHLAPRRVASPVAQGGLLSASVTPSDGQKQQTGAQDESAAASHRHQTQLLTDPLEMQISEGASLLSSVSPGMQPSSQSPRDPSLLQLSDNDQTPSAVTPDVDAELQWPNQEDALRSDIMGTAGCRITRCLVQQILQPAPEPTAVPGSSVEKAPANKGSHSISVGKPPKVVGKPPSRLKGQTGTGKARSAANLAAVGGPSASAVGIPLSSQGRSAQQPMTTAKASAITKPTTSCLKRQSVSSVRSDAPKKARCATAAGLNPKFLTIKDEVLKLIGDRQNVLEGELRRRMGNNPDTSKALRKLHSEGLLQRTGHGGRPDPFKWTKVETTAALSSAVEALVAAPLDCVASLQDPACQ
ncbi:hypothetical protein WJX82_002164 [Trebouxia sp. C0006]